MKRILFSMILFVITTNIYSQSTIESAFLLKPSIFLNYTPPQNAQAQVGPDYGCLTGNTNRPVWFTFHVCGTDSEPSDLNINFQAGMGNSLGVIIWGPFDDTINIASKLTSNNIDTCFLVSPTPGFFNLVHLQFPKIYYGMIAVDSSTQVNQIGLYSMRAWVDDRCGISNSRVANYKQDICLITLDSTTQKNMLVWEKKNNFQTASFNIYREGVVANQFDSIGNVPVTATSTFIDNAVNPNQRSYRYKMAAIDSSGHTELYYNNYFHDSALVHATTHVQGSLGLNGEVNLSWNPYVGFPYNTFYIYRGPSVNNLQVLDSVSTSTLSYTDFNPLPGINYYKVTVRKNGGCSPDGGITVYIQAFSNIPYTTITGINELNQTTPIKIGPIPTNNTLTIKSEKTFSDCHIKIYNSIGEIVYSDNFNGTEKVIEYNFEKGIYILHISGESTNYSRKIVRE